MSVLSRLWMLLLLASAGCGRGAPVPPPIPAPNIRPSTEVAKPELPVEAPEPEILPVTAPPVENFDRSAATERILIFTPQGPLLLDLVLAIEDQPYREARREFVTRMLNMAGESGRPLAWQDALKSQAFRLGEAAGFAEMNLNAQRQFVQRFDLNRNGMVDMDEAARFVARMGGGSEFSLESSTSTENSRRGRLWDLLDANQDGVLSEDEVLEASPLLTGRDADDDEVLTRQELQGKPAVDEMMTNRGRGTQRPVAVRLNRSTNWGAFQYELEDRYLHNGRLAAESFPRDPGLFDFLDADGSGRLTNGEMARLLEYPPHAVFEINLGAGELRLPGVYVLKPNSQSGEDELSLIAISTGSGVQLQRGDTQIVLTVRDADSALLRPRLQTQFAQVDQDSNGYLDEEEASGAGEEFAAFDADGDGRLYFQEFYSAARWRQLPSLTRIVLRVNDEGRDLFPALDRNSDERLGARELRRASQRISALDRNGDGEILPTELPSRITVRLTRGEPNTADGAMSPGIANVADANSKVPLWFTAMDGNGDGDVSPREFLGTKRQFAGIDEDQDGFINPAEAASAAVIESSSEEGKQ